jgi:probable rRNA maturation factor
MIFVEINPNLIVDLKPGVIENALQMALQELPQSQPIDLTVVVTDDHQIQDLNQKFRGIGTTTDVLSFPSNEIDPENGNIYLGDILISYTQAFEQARQSGHPVESEILLLAVHGILHLFGFDHVETEEKTRMWALQEKILRSLDLAGINIPD